MNRHTWAYFSMLLLCLFSCQKKSTTPHEIPEEKTNYVINNLGDTIPTGVWLPITGKHIDIDNIGELQTTPLKIETKNISLTPKEYPVDEPKIAYITEPPKVIIPGENGAPLPKTIKVKGRVVPAKYPKPVPAGTPQIKDRAIADIRYLGMRHGMRYGIVRSLMWDSKGYLWMGTHGGVSRYDGKNFLHFEIEEGLPNSRVPSMFEDSKGNMWFGTVQGLARYNGQSFIHFTVREDFPSISFNNFSFSFLEDKAGNLWIKPQPGGNRNGETWMRFTLENKGTEGTLTIYNQDQTLLGNILAHGLLDRKGNFWLGSNNGSIYTYRPAQNGEGERFFVFEQTFENGWVDPVLQDSDGVIWFSTFNGDIKFHLNTEKLAQTLLKEKDETNRKDTLGTIQYFPSIQDWNRRILEDEDKKLWFINRGNGVFRYNPQKQTYTHLAIQEGLTNDGIRDGLQDEYGKFWLATFGGGVNIHNPNSFQHYGLNQGLMSNRILSIVEDEEGKLWFGAEYIGGGIKKIQQYDPVNKIFTNIEWEGINRNIRISQDHSNNIWGTYNNRLCKIDPNRPTQMQCLDLVNISDFNIGGVGKIDNSQRLWMLTFNSALVYYQEVVEKGRFTFFPIKKQLLNGGVRMVLEDKKENIWVASNSGVSKLILNESDDSSENIQVGKIIHYTENEGLKSNTLVYMLLEDRYGDIWAATQNGLHRFIPEAEGPGRFEHFGVEDGLSYHDIRSLQEDRQGNIWIGTKKGLSVLVRDTASNEPRNDFKFHAFTHEDGLKSLDFMQRSVLLDSQNTLWMGTIQGLISIDLNTFKLPTLPPKNVELTHISINQQFIDYRILSDTSYANQFTFGHALSFDSVASFQNYPISLRLPYDINTLTFHVSAIDWYAPHKIQYQFWMSDMDKDWSDPQSEPKIDYRNLDHGKYTLRIRAIGAAQIPSEEFTYTFQILPPWWLTWWAKAFYALNAILLVYGIVRWRTVSLQQRQRELEQTVEKRTAEVVEEQKRSDGLLLNILPAAVAKELKATGQNQPIFYEEVSILFTDFKGYTNIVASIPGRKLVKELDEIFKAYDDIMEEVGLEKIQTVGDAYLAAGGVPEPDPEHAIKCVRAGKKIIAYLEERNKRSSIKWQVRVGIHSGPITAGVIGKKKFSYDLFGDSINIAARMESSSEAGKINISAYTHDLVHKTFPCTYRGKINAKGKGELDMYFVD